MRTAVFYIGATALFGFVLAGPAAAQMCGGGQQAQASSSAQQGGMCGMAQADDPMADKSAQTPKATGMCPCCKNMAMMKGGMMGGQKDMPGMDMPK